MVGDQLLAELVHDVREVGGRVIRVVVDVPIHASKLYFGLDSLSRRNIYQYRLTGDQIQPLNESESILPSACCYLKWSIHLFSGEAMFEKPIITDDINTWVSSTNQSSGLTHLLSLYTTMPSMCKPLVGVLSVASESTW